MRTTISVGLNLILSSAPNAELFKGLEIEQLEKEWTKYPVLHLDLNTSKYDEKNSLITVSYTHLELLSPIFLWRCVRTTNAVDMMFDV